MGENIISTGLTPDPVAVAGLPDAPQRLESSCTLGRGGAAGSPLYALGDGAAGAIYLKRHPVTRGAVAV